MTSSVEGATRSRRASESFAFPQLSALPHLGRSCQTPRVQTPLLHALLHVGCFHQPRWHV